MNQNPRPNFLTGPLQVPLFPLYGYDNLEEAEHDFDYMKQLYPRDTRKIQAMIEDTCDRLEYAGSVMFDEYPDRLQLALMANKIYNQLTPEESSNWLRSMIEIMLCNEMCQRRRRYRSRRRWI